MEWKLSEEQQAYQEALRGWLSDVAGPQQVRAWSEAGGYGDATPFERAFGDGGMAGVGFPEEWGGQGGGVVELALTAEELARAGAPSASWLAGAMALPLLVGAPEVARSAIAGEAVALLVSADGLPDAATGPTAGLVADGEGRVSGSVADVLAGDRARRFVAPVRGPGGEVSFRLVERDAAGVAVRPRGLLDRSRSVAEVRLSDAPSKALEGGPELLDRVTDLAAVLVAADALGAMERMLDLAVGYSLQRQQFGVPIGSFQAVKHAAASILVDVEAGRSGVYYAAASVEARGEECALHAAAVKAQVTAAAARAADAALTVHGAIGYTWEHDLQLHFKRARLDAVLFGTPREWNERIARGLSLI